LLKLRDEDDKSKFNAVGESVAVNTLRESQMEALTAKEILHVRPLTAAAA
jgi:hypothetical protein